MSAPLLLLLACILSVPTARAQGREVAIEHVPISPLHLAQIEASVIRYAACTQEIACLECAVAPAQVDTLSLTTYFQQALRTLPTQALTGLVLVHINVTAQGVPCCRLLQNYTDHTNAQVQALHLDQAVARMPRWKPVRVAGHPVSSSTSLRLTFASQTGLRAEPFIPGGFHAQLTDTLGLHHTGWRWVKSPASTLALPAGEYAQFTFSISATGKVYAVEAGRTNMSASQEQACRQVLEAALLRPLTVNATSSKGYYSFVGK